MRVTAQNCCGVGAVVFILTTHPGHTQSQPETGAFGNQDVAYLCTDAAKAMKDFRFSTEIMVTKYDEFGQLATARYSASQAKLIEIEAKLMPVAGPAVYTFLYEPESQLMKFLKSGQWLMTHARTPGSTDESTLNTAMEEFNMEARRIVSELPDHCRSDFQSKVTN